MVCVFVGLSSLILFGSVASALSNWGSIELQDAVRKALADPRLSGTGLTLAESLRWLRRILLGVVLLSIAGVVFAVFAARGHRPSRVYLTVMAGITCLIFVATGGLIGLLSAAFAIVCGLQLWSPASGAWFDAKNGITPAAAVILPPQGYVTAGATLVHPGDEPSLPATGETSVEPGARRPKPVLVAGLVTLVAAWLVATFCGYFMFVYFTARDSYIESLSTQPSKGWLESSNLAPEQVAHWAFIGCAVLGPIALFACAAASLMLAGKAYGRVLTLVLAVVTVPLSLLAVGVGIPWMAAAVAVIVLLRKPEARAWFAGA